MFIDSEYRGQPARQRQDSMLCWAGMIPVVMPTLHSYLEMVSSELTEGLRESVCAYVCVRTCVCVCAEREGCWGVLDD
jgi:hypothetical protein